MSLDQNLIPLKRQRRASDDGLDPLDLLALLVVFIATMVVIEVIIETIFPKQDRTTVIFGRQLKNNSAKGMFKVYGRHSVIDITDQSPNNALADRPTKVIVGQMIQISSTDHHFSVVRTDQEGDDLLKCDIRRLTGHPTSEVLKPGSEYRLDQDGIYAVIIYGKINNELQPIAIMYVLKIESTRLPQLMEGVNELLKADRPSPND